MNILYHEDITPSLRYTYIYNIFFLKINIKRFLAGDEGIEPTPGVLETLILPLN